MNAHFFSGVCLNGLVSCVVFGHIFLTVDTKIMQCKFVDVRIMFVHTHTKHCISCMQYIKFCVSFACLICLYRFNDNHQNFLTKALDTVP